MNDDDDDDLADFRGSVRLFPLPNLVLFPRVMQPLHIFEPRYRQMTADALDDDRLIGIVRQGPDGKSDGVKYDFEMVGCVGKIVAEQRLEGGRYNLLLRGVKRFLAVREIESDKPYRQVTVDLLDEIPFVGAGHEEETYRQRLFAAAPRWLPPQTLLQNEFKKLLSATLDLGMLADMITFTVPIDPKAKQVLLEELDIRKRLDQLLRLLELKKAKAPPAKFPPDFSVN